MSAGHNESVAFLGEKLFRYLTPKWAGRDYFKSFEVFGEKGQICWVELTKEPQFYNFLQSCTFETAFAPLSHRRFIVFATAGSTDSFIAYTLTLDPINDRLSCWGFEPIFLNRKIDFLPPFFELVDRLTDHQLNFY